MNTECQKVRVERKNNYVYKIVRVSDGSFYYGIHSTDRDTDSYYGSGTVITNSLNKYGKSPAHVKEILGYYPTRQLAANREAELVTREVIEHPLCMNLQLGGIMVYRKVDSAEAQRSRTESLRSHYANSERSKSTRGALSAAFTGRTFSNETITRMRESAHNRIARLKMEGRWGEICEKRRVANLGRVNTPESIQKQVDTRRKNDILLGRTLKHTPEAKEKIRVAGLGSAYSAVWWELTDMCGNSFYVNNLKKWVREHKLLRTEDGAGIRRTTKSTGRAPKPNLYTVKKLGNTAPIDASPDKINPEPAPKA